jgi:hypothetical protein
MRFEDVGWVLWDASRFNSEKHNERSGLNRSLAGDSDEEPARQSPATTPSPLVEPRKRMVSRQSSRSSLVTFSGTYSNTAWNWNLNVSVLVRILYYAGSKMAGSGEGREREAYVLSRLHGTDSKPNKFDSRPCVSTLIPEDILESQQTQRIARPKPLHLAKTC